MNFVGIHGNGIIANLKAFLSVSCAHSSAFETPAVTVFRVYAYIEDCGILNGLVGKLRAQTSVY